MTRGNQRDKRRAEVQKASAGAVSVVDMSAAKSASDEEHSRRRTTCLAPNWQKTRRAQQRLCGKSRLLVSGQGSLLSISRYSHLDSRCEEKGRRPEKVTNHEHNNTRRFERAVHSPRSAEAEMTASRCQDIVMSLCSCIVLDGYSLLQKDLGLTSPLAQVVVSLDVPAVLLMFRPISTSMSIVTNM